MRLRGLRADPDFGSGRYQGRPIGIPYQVVAREASFGAAKVVLDPAERRATIAAHAEALAKAGLKAELAEVTMKPTMENELAGEEASRMRRLLDALENLDDVQDVYTTAVLD